MHAGCRSAKRLASVKGLLYVSLVLLFQGKEEVSGYWFVVLWVSVSSGESIFR